VVAAATVTCGKKSMAAAAILWLQSSEQCVATMTHECYVRDVKKCFACDCCLAALESDLDARSLWRFNIQVLVGELLAGLVCSAAAMIGMN